ncbi:MAG: phosphatase PAP2 family protein [Bryobacterales bacterium]|nr:phosphatase PAP2 family protein [Bryobacterales bacterium]
MTPFLPPYGLLPTLANPSEAAPPDWRNTTRFPDWLRERLTFFREHLWPEWSNGDWQGAAAHDMIARTKADLGITRSLRSSGFDRVFDALPLSTTRHLDCTPHRSLFTEEDSGPGRPGEALRLYDRGVNRELLEAMPRLFDRGAGRKFSIGAIYWFKQRLQRPRPFQAGLLLNLPFDHEGARTALHPAMISGHAIQGMCMLLCAAERLHLDKVEMADSCWHALQQYCVDFGDRRVMAGVHYASDNLSSWIVALDLVEHTVDPAVRQKVKDAAWSAIRRSLVYQRLDGLAGEEKALFAPAWAELHRLST